MRSISIIFVSLIISNIAYSAPQKADSKSNSAKSEKLSECEKKITDAAMENFKAGRAAEKLDTKSSDENIKAFRQITTEARRKLSDAISCLHE